MDFYFKQFNKYKNYGFLFQTIKIIITNYVNLI